MQFVYPEFLYALSALAIPVIIHLFNFRRFKKVFFTNVRFLKEIKEETTSRSKLKHLLVLLARMLAITFLVLAFAQPYRPHGSALPGGGEKAISVFIDNSFSMESVSREGTYLDEAKSRAREIALAAKPSDNFQLLTNDFEARHQRFISREQFLSWIDDIKISPASRQLSEAIARQRDLLQGAGVKSKLAYCISDYQSAQADLSNIEGDSSIAVYLVPVAIQPAGNVYIDSCWFTSPVVQANIPVQLNARLVNASESDAENIQVKLLINGVQKSLAGASLGSGASTIARLTFTVTEPGIKKGELEINDHPVTFDNHWFFSFTLEESQPLASIDGHGPSAPLNALFAADPYFKLTNTPQSQIDYSALPDYKVVFLNQLPEIPSGLAGELEKYVRGGGTVTVFPDTAFDAVSYNRFLSALQADTFAGLNLNPDRIGSLTTESPLFADVFEKQHDPGDPLDLPTALRHFELSSNLRTTREMVMKLQGGAAFLNRYTAGSGTLYLFSTPPHPAFGNFTRHALFVPVMFRIALLSGNSKKLFYQVGSDEHVAAPARTAGEEIFHLVNTSQSFDIIPEIRAAGGQVSLVLHDAVRQAGIYDLMLSDRPAGALAFNYNRIESSLSFLTAGQIAAEIEKNNTAGLRLLETSAGSLTPRLLTLNEGTRYWKWCIMLALLFLAAEILLLKFWK